jgi:cytochrome P450
MSMPERPLTPAMAYQLFVSVLGGQEGSDPYPAYRRLRESTPVLRGPDGGLALTRYDDCEAAFRHRGLGLPHDPMLAWSVGRPVAKEARRALSWLTRTMMLSNPPEHTRLRRLLGSAFTPRHVAELQPEISACTGRLLDEIAGQPGADFVSEVALRLPATTIGELLGIPVADRATFVPLCMTLGKPLISDEAIAAAIAAQAELRGYFTDLLAAKRRAPADDLLSRLANRPDRDRLDDDEIIATAILLFGAGFETTTNLLCNGLAALLINDDQLRLLRRRPELTDSAVEEMLRYDSPIQVDTRTALEPTTLAGVKLAEGEPVVAILGAANRDPERFPDPDRFDITRDQGGHLAFTSGLHFCLGSHLARLEARTLFGLLMTRFQSIELAAEPQIIPDLQRRRAARLLVTIG